jgi:hypothetical protein
LVTALRKIFIKAPICGDIMLSIIVRVMVVPTTRYHSTVKSVYWPAKMGKAVGRETWEILAFTRRITIPYQQ